jgi:hypothetical protein
MAIWIDVLPTGETLYIWHVCFLHQSTYTTRMFFVPTQQSWTDSLLPRKSAHDSTSQLDWVAHETRPSFSPNNNHHYQKYCYRMRPIRIGSLWTASKTLSTMIHIVLPISIIGGRVISSGSPWKTAADNSKYYQQWLRRPTAFDNLVISSGSKPWPSADNGVYNQ